MVELTEEGNGETKGLESEDFRGSLFERRDLTTTLSDGSHPRVEKENYSFPRIRVG